ncbi:MAG: 4Fe-4S binding protein [Candidatus Krumholzibacteria bacterium]|nr:4Fe-4S binding protein [Candidatus Krumholzibacteria bacterium]
MIERSSTEKSGGGIRIDREKCVVCGACSAVCPSEALIVEGLALVAVPERCRPCAQAALICPTGALTCPVAEASRNRFNRARQA